MVKVCVQVSIMLKGKTQLLKDLRANNALGKENWFKLEPVDFRKRRPITDTYKKSCHQIFFRICCQNYPRSRKSGLKKIGFGAVIAFRMKRYAHKLGYTLVEALDRDECSIRMEDGTIKISDVVVHKVLGLPRGAEIVVVRECKQLLGAWESQFAGKPFSKITASMIARKIKNNGSATFTFKLNFLVLLSNFLVEYNNNGYVKNDIVGFCGEIEKCSNYNWCGFVIDKLLTTHKFWAGNPSIRNFTGSLPLLTYLYLDRVSTARTRQVERSKPSYIAWTDEIIKAEENYIIENNCFGKGEILEWTK